MVFIEIIKIIIIIINVKMKTTYADCIASLVPGASLTISANDHLTLEWLNNDYTKPTESEILIRKTIN